MSAVLTNPGSIKCLGCGGVARWRGGVFTLKDGVRVDTWCCEKCNAITQCEFCVYDNPDKLKFFLDGNAVTVI